MTRTWSAPAAVAGLGYLWFIVAASMAAQWTGGRPPTHWLWAQAALALPVVALALATRPAAPTLALGALFTVWAGAGAASAWRLTGGLDHRTVALAMVCAGLFLGVAAAPPRWTGWSILLLGGGYLLVLLAVYYKGYYSLGGEFGWAAEWRSTAGLPYPAGKPARVAALLTDVPGIAQFTYLGPTGNANQTAGFLAPFLAFVVPFLSGGRRNRLAQWLLAATILVPGVFVLYLLEARSALAAVAAAVLVGLAPLRRAGSRTTAAALAVAAPLAVMVPFLLTTRGPLALSGRDWVWQAWETGMRPTPVWGLGPPGSFPNPHPDIVEGAFWPHANNELLHAWTVGGLLGLAAAALTLAALAWTGARHSDRDGKALAALVACCTVLMAMEVLSPFSGYWVHLGLVWVIAVCARSAALAPDRSGGSPAADREQSVLPPTAATSMSTRP